LVATARASGSQSRAIRSTCSPPTDCTVDTVASTLAQDRADPIEERDAGDGQLDAMRRAPQQRAAEQPLKRADLTAERRLGNVEALGRPPEVELLGDGDEGTQVAQLDRFRRLREGDHVLLVGHPPMVTARPRAGDAVRA